MTGAAPRVRFTLTRRGKRVDLSPRERWARQGTHEGSPYTRQRPRSPANPPRAWRGSDEWFDRLTMSGGKGTHEGCPYTRHPTPRHGLLAR